jgi:hypothetical protein
MKTLLLIGCIVLGVVIVYGFILALCKISSESDGEE